MQLEQQRSVALTVHVMISSLRFPPPPPSPLGATVGAARQNNNPHIQRKQYPTIYQPYLYVKPH